MFQVLKSRLVSGDSAAFAELYDGIADGIFHYLVTQTGTPEDAADLLQETFIRIYRARGRLAEVDNLKAYCYRIAHHEMLRWRKSHARRPTSGELLFEVAQSDDGDTGEVQELAAQALEGLPPHYRQVVELKFFSHLTLAEIGQVLEKPQGTVATWYRAALTQMQAKLRPDKQQGLR